MKNFLKNENIKIFIEEVYKKTGEFGGKLKIKPIPIKRDPGMDGEFSEFDMSITCYYNPKTFYWLGVLAHEYAHLMQCIKQEKIWIDFQKKVLDSQDLDVIFQKRNTNSFSKKNRLYICKYIIPLELDADKKAIKYIKKYKLPVNIKDYTSNSNLILYKYLYWAEKGIWPDFTNKKTGKNLDPNLFSISKFKDVSEYRKYSDIPIRISAIFDSA